MTCAPEPHPKKTKLIPKIEWYVCSKGYAHKSRSESVQAGREVYAWWNISLSLPLSRLPLSLPLSPSLPLSLSPSLRILLL